MLVWKPWLIPGGWWRRSWVWIFRTSPPGKETTDLRQQVCQWRQTASKTYRLQKRQTASKMHILQPTQTASKTHWQLPRHTDYSQHRQLQKAQITAMTNHGCMSSFLYVTNSFLQGTPDQNDLTVTPAVVSSNWHNKQQQCFSLILVSVCEQYASIAEFNATHSIVEILNFPLKDWEQNGHKNTISK